MQTFIDLLTTMPFWWWLVFALVLLGIELMTGSTYFLWPAIAAVGAGIVALVPGMPWFLEVLVFSLATIALSFWAPAKVKPWLHRSTVDHPNLNDRGAQKVGKRAIVEADFENGAGKVRLGDTLWLAEAESGEALAAQTQVVVTGVEGTKLFVKPA